MINITNALNFEDTYSTIEQPQSNKAAISVPQQKKTCK